ncbi:MAG: hypothetical protein WCG78_04955, partial [Candidatus Omnitrophota bacterium]
DLQGAAGSEAAADTQIGGGVAGAVVTAVYHRPPGAALGASDAWKTLPVRAVVPVAPGNALPLSQILTETLGVSAGDIAGIAVRDESGQCVHRYDAPSWLQHKLDRDRQWGPEGDRHCPAGTIEVFYYPRGESALSPSAYSCAAQPALPNFCVSMNLMNAGAAIYDNHVISRNGLLNVQQRIDRIADIGAGMIYLNGPWRPSEASKGVHFNPAPDDPTKTTPGTGAVRFVESGNTTVRVEKYPTKMRTVDGVHLNDRNGSQFSSRVGVWNPSLAEGIDPEEAFVDTVVRAHARGIKVVSDFFFWIAPDMVDETNYRVTHYREIGDSLDGKPGNNPGESDRLNREFRNQPDEAAKKEWIRKELLKYEKWDKFFAVRVKEPGREERVIFVEKPYDGTNADQAHINLESENEKEVEDYFFARMKYLIDLGVDVIRVDLPHVLLPHGSETKQMKSFMTRAKAYAATQGRVVKFIGETVEWEDLGKKPYDESVQYRIAGAEYGAVYTKRLHQVFMKIEREGWGAGALHEQVEALLHRPLSYLAFLTDFDRPSAKSIGGSPEPLTMLGVALAHLCAEGKPIEWDAQRIGKPKPDLIFMMDWEDLLGLFGRLITVPGGGNGVDIDNWDGHLYAADRAEIDLQADPASQLEVFDRSPLVEVIRDFNRAVLSRKQTYVENSGVQSSNSDPSRFYTLSWRDEDGAWTIVTLDVRPGDTVMDAWVKMPAEALTQGGKDVFVPVDPLGQSGSLAVQQKDGMTVIGGINFLKGGKKYSFVRLMPRSASLAAPVISPRDTARVAESVLRARAVDERLTTARHDISREALEGAPTGAVSPQAARAWAEELIGAVPVILPPSMSFNDIYEYLRYLDEVKIVVAAADSESALSGLNEFIGRTGGNVRAWLVGDNHKIEAIIRKNELKNLAQLDHTIVQMHQNVIVIEPEPDHGGSAVPLVSFGQDETEREGVAKKIPATLTTAVDLAIREGAHVILKGNTPTDPLMRAVLQRKGEVFAPGEIMSHARYYPETLLGPVLIADGAINPVENLKEEDARVQKKVKIARNTWSLAARCGMNDPVVCLVVGKKSGDGRELAECIRVKEELERLLPGAAIEIMTAAEAFTPQKKYEPGRGRILIYPDINANIPYKACATRLPWSLEPYYDTSTVDGRVSVLRKILPSGALGGYLAVTIPCPDAGAEQKIRLLNIAREDLRRFGIEAPRIAMVSFTDRGKEFPTSPTINDAHAVIHDFHERHHPGHIKLMAWDMAFSAKAGNIKGKNEISGDPDIVMAPTNTAGETIRFLLGHIDALRIPWTERASTSCGGNIAVAIVSRSDEGPEKANALALGTFVAAEERVLRERRERESTLAEPGSLPASTTAGALDSAVLRPLAAQDRMKTVMGAALPTQSETEVVERMIGETRIECKRALLCQVRSLWLLRKLHQAGIKAWILDNKSHYWVETDEMILDAYPEGTGMGWLFVQYNFQMKEYVIFNKRSDAPERVKKLYKNGVRNEQLTNIACSGDIRAFYGEIKQYAVAVIAYFRAALYPKNAADQLDEGEVRLINGIIRSYVQYVSEIDVQALAETKAEMGCAVMVERSVLRPLPALERSPYSDDMRALRAETVIKRQVAGVRQLCGCGENDVEIISVRNDSFPEAPRQLRQGGNNTIYRAKRNGKYVIVRFPFSDMVEPYEFEKAQRLRDLFPWNNFEEASGPAKILDAGRVAVDVKSGEESPALSYIMTEFCEGATLDGLSPSSKYITACIVKGVLECAYAFHRRALCPLDYKRSNFTWTVTGGGRVIVKYVDYIDMINFRYPTGLASREITDLMPLLRELGNHVPEVDESIFGVYALKKALLKGDLQEVERIYQNEIFPLIDSAIKKFALESPAASLSFAGAGREFEPAPRALVGAVLRPRAREERAGVQALARGEINVDRDFEFVRRIERGELTRIPHPRGGKTYGEGLVPPLPALIMKYRGEDEALMREGSYIVEVVGGEEPDGGAALAALFRETLAFLDPQGASSHLPHLAGVVDIGRTALGERMGLKGWAVVYAAPGGDGFLEFCRMLAGGGRDHGLLSEPKEDPRRPNDPDLLKEKARVNRYNERMKLNNDRQRERLFCEAVLRSVDAYLAAISRMSYVHGSIRPDTLRIESDTGGRRLRPVVIADISTISRLGPLLPGDDREMAERKKCSVHADTPSSGERVTRIKRGCPVEKCCLPRDDIYALCSIFMEGLHMLRLKTTSDTPLLDAFEKVLKRHQGSATLSAGICHPSQFKRELLIESFRLRLTRYLDCVMEYMN